MEIYRKCIVVFLLLYCLEEGYLSISIILPHAPSQAIPASRGDEVEKAKRGEEDQGDQDQEQAAAEATAQS
jgi:hypothetical protein